MDLDGFIVVVFSPELLILGMDNKALPLAALGSVVPYLKKKSSGFKNRNPFKSIQIRQFLSTKKYIRTFQMF